MSLSSSERLSQKILIIDNLSNSMMNFNGVLLQTLVQQGHEVHAWAPVEDPRVRRWAEQNQIHFATYPLQRTGTQPFYDLYTFGVLAKRMLALRPDIVLSFTVKPIIYGSWAAKLSGVKQIYSVITGLSPAYVNYLQPKERWVQKLQKSMYRFSLCHNKTVFFYNRDDRDVFLADGLLSSIEQTQVTHGAGVPLAYFTRQPDVDEPYVLMIARLVRHKGIYEYVEAAKRLKKDYPDATFALLGPYHEHPDAIDKEDLVGWVQSGIIDYFEETDDVRPYLARASFCVLPTYREGIPRAIVEAMAAGKAIVTTNVAGCKEVVKHGYNGLLVEPRQPEALADAIEQLLCNGAMRKEMGAKGRKMVEETFASEKAIQPILDKLNR